jgi:branched-chain amino acid transport system ATP-binding protein
MSLPNMIEVTGLTVRRGRSDIVRGVDLAVQTGACVCLVGSNGAGKTTLVEGLLGTLPTSAERMVLEGESLQGRPPWVRVKRGLVVVPQERELFPRMTVLENLMMGGHTAKREQVEQSAERVFNLFPRLQERQRQAAGTLSGGERSMLAIGRGLMAAPRMLVLDEPSLGLAPMIVTDIMRTINEINREGTTVLLIEQNIHHAFALASYGYVLEQGAVIMSGPTSELRSSELVREGYFGPADEVGTR